MRIAAPPYNQRQPIAAVTKPATTLLTSTPNRIPDSTSPEARPTCPSGARAAANGTSSCGAMVSNPMRKPLTSNVGTFGANAVAARATETARIVETTRRLRSSTSPRGTTSNNPMMKPAWVSAGRAPRTPVPTPNSCAMTGSRGWA